MTTWEYARIQVKVEPGSGPLIDWTGPDGNKVVTSWPNAVSALNGAGSDGWELATLDSSINGLWVYTLKRSASG